MADQLCTPSQVKLRIFPAGVADASDDGLISELIDQASDWIEFETKRKLVADNAATYVFDTDEGYALRVPYGLRSITSMGVNNLSHQPDSGGSYTTIPAADIILRPKPIDARPGWAGVYTEVRISRGTLAGSISRFGRIDNGATITGNFGFATTPPAIVSAAIALVVSAYAFRKQGGSGSIGADGAAAIPWGTLLAQDGPTARVIRDYTYQAVA